MKDYQAHVLVCKEFPSLLYIFLMAIFISNRSPPDQHTISSDGETLQAQECLILPSHAVKPIHECIYFGPD